MEKSLIERFISKYNLSGAAEAVVLHATSKGLNTKFISDDKNVLGIISASKIELEEGEYGVYDTAQLRSLLGVLEDAVKIKVTKKEGKPTGFILSDKGTKVTYVLADKDNIPKVPDLKALPDADVVIKIDAHFLNTFVKAKGALPDVETFTVLCDGKKTDVVIGYSELNTNRVSFHVETEEVAEMDPISFDARYLREILLANKEMKSGSLNISSKGLAIVTFNIDDFEVSYYLVKKDRQD